MSSTGRGSRLSRAVAFFREAPYDEARVAFTLVQEAMAERKLAAGAGKAVKRAAQPRSRSQAKRMAAQGATLAAPSAEQPLVSDAHQESLANA